MPDQYDFSQLTFKKVDLIKDRDLLLDIECEINYANESFLKERYDFPEYHRRWLAEPRPQKTADAFTEVLEDERTMCEFVETADGDRAAFFLVTFTDLTGFDIVSAYLEDIHVFEQYRKRGIGSFILSHVEARAKKAGAQWLGLSTSAFNAASRGLYEKNGYRIYRYSYEKEL